MNRMMREPSAVARLQDRQEWKFFGALRSAAPGLAVGWWVLLVLRGLAPVVLAIRLTRRPTPR